MWERNIAGFPPCVPWAGIKPSAYWWIDRCPSQLSRLARATPGFFIGGCELGCWVIAKYAKNGTSFPPPNSLHPPHAMQIPLNEMVDFTWIRYLLEHFGAGPTTELSGPGAKWRAPRSKISKNCKMPIAGHQTNCGALGLHRAHAGKASSPVWRSSPGLCCIRRIKRPTE